MKNSIIKFLASLLILISFFYMGTSDLLAIQTVVVANGDTGYSDHHAPPVTHTTYRVRLGSVTFNGLPENIFIRNVDMRVRTFPTHVEAGDCASFSVAGPTFIAKNYWSGYGGSGQEYCIAVNSAANNGFTVGMEWTP